MDTSTEKDTAAGSTALIVVDVQNDFCPGGALATDRGDAVARSIAQMDTSTYDYVLATKDWHIDPGEHFAPDGETPNFSTTWPVHCVAGTTGADFHPAIAEMTFDEVFRKGAYSAAYSGFEGGDIPLAEWLHSHGVSSVDIVGIATEHCVRATVIDACAHVRTRVLPQLCSPVSEEAVPAALADMEKAGAQIVSG